MEKSILFKVKESAVHALEATTQIELFSYQLKGGKKCIFGYRKTKAKHWKYYT